MLHLSVLMLQGTILLLPASEIILQVYVFML